MAHVHRRSSPGHHENELWFNMASSSGTSMSPPRPLNEQVRSSERSAYWTTSDRRGTCSTKSRSPSRYAVTPSTSDLDKPLPPSPSGAERGSRPLNSWSGILHRDSTRSATTTHLQPEPYTGRGTSLGLNTQTPYQHNYSRSMPSSPYSHDQAWNPQPPATPPRARSSMAGYADTSHYQSYSQPHQHPILLATDNRERSNSTSTYFDSMAPSRSRTFPDSTLNPVARENIADRPRPRTWLSPTEPFSDISQSHLFAEAMTGLPNDADSFASAGLPQLQGSLFARRSRNDTMALPLLSSNVPPAFPSTSHSASDGWQNFEPPPSILPPHNITSFSNASQSQRQEVWQPPNHMASISRELELLGLEDENRSDDELPNYAQSQAEANEKKRAEASARARELEARWRGTRR